MRLLSPLLLPLLLAACSSESFSNGTLLIVTGREDDTFTIEPAVTRIDINFTDRATDTPEVTRLSRGSKVPEGLDLGSSRYGDFSIVGTDAEGKKRVGGRTPLVDVSYFVEAELALMAARTDRFSRVDGAFSVAAGKHPLVGLIGAGNVWVVTNDEDYATSDGYSVGYYTQLDPPSDVASVACPNSPCDAATLAVGGAQWGVLIGGDWAYGIDMLEGTVVDVAAPTELDGWGEVVGGRTIPTPGYTAFVVGATRSRATNVILALDANANITAQRLKTARAGAAATWMSKRGLAVVGGSTKGKGVELRPYDVANKILELDYPADPVTGAALLEESESTLLRVGGRLPDGTAAPTVRIDMDCEEDCEAVAVPEWDLDFASGTGFVEDGNLLVVAEADDGTNTVYRLVDDAFKEVPLRQSRAYATAYILPTGQLGLIGGVIPGSTESRRTLEVVAF